MQNKLNNKLVQVFRNSCFRQMTNPSSMRFQRFNQEMLTYVDYEKADELDSKNIRQNIEDFNIQDYVPEYQRGPDKWSLDMKQKFIINTLKGVKTTIILCRHSESENAVILDGQQRLTALKGFLTNEFSINIDSEDYFYRDIIEEVKQMAVYVGMSIITAKDEKEEVQFYIDMNENITHSKEDIQIAKDYLKCL